MSPILVLAKYVSIVIGAVLGVLGVTTKTHDAEGKLTLAARCTLVGLIASAVTAGVIQWVEWREQEDAAKDRQTQLQKSMDQQAVVLRDVRRNLYAIDRFGIEIEASVDTRNLASLLAPWDRYLSEASKRFGHAPSPFERDHDGSTLVSFHADDEGRPVPATLTLSERSPLLPSSPTGPFLQVACVLISRRKISVEETDRGCTSNDADAAFFLPMKPPAIEDASRRGKRTVVYSPGSETISVRVRYPSATLVRDNGRVRSVLDFPGAHGIAYLTSPAERSKLVSVSLTLGRGESFSWGEHIGMRGPRLLPLELHGNAAASFAILDGDVPAAGAAAENQKIREPETRASR